VNNARFDRITGIAYIPISYGISSVENFPKVDENNDGKIIDSVVNEIKKIVKIPIKFEIFGIK
jgi:hypothetical protein